MYDNTFSKFAIHQIRHQATHKVGCQPGDYIWSLESSSGLCVGMYELTYSLCHSRGVKTIRTTETTDSFATKKCSYIVYVMQHCFLA